MLNYYFILPAIFLLFLNLTFAQNAREELWNDIPETSIQTAGERYIIPRSYRTLELDIQAMKSSYVQIHLFYQYINCTSNFSNCKQHFI